MRSSARGRPRCLQRYPCGVFPIKTEEQPETGHASGAGPELALAKSGKAWVGAEEELGLCGAVSSSSGEDVPVLVDSECLDIHSFEL